MALHRRLQMALGSSSQAAAGTLGKLAETPKLAGRAIGDMLLELAEQAGRQQESAKADRLLQLLEEYPRQDGRVHAIPGNPGDVCRTACQRRGMTVARLSRRPDASGQGGGDQRNSAARPAS